MKKKLIIAAVVLLVIAVIGGVIYFELTHGNRRLVDTSYRFDRAILALPNGEIVEGKVNSDTVQVTIGGKTYLTHYSNVVLIND